MAKQGKGKDPESAARRKLADAQTKLQLAQDRRGRVATEGEQEVERARKRAAIQLGKATQEVERRAERMARAESKVLSLQPTRMDTSPKPATSTKPAKAVKAAKSSKSSKSSKAANAVPTVASPQDVADHLEDIQSDLVEQSTSESVLLPNGFAEESTMGGVDVGDLNRYEALVLDALQNGFAQNGATFTDWLAATNLSKRTFLRARKHLVESGLVRREGEGQGALYFPTDLSRP